MAQIQFTANITIAPAAQPLAESASSGDAQFQVGVAGSVALAAISGGQAPYSASVDASSPNPLPPGLAVSIDGSNNLIVSGTPTTDGGPAPVLIDVVDALGNSVASVRARI